MPARTLPRSNEKISNNRRLIEEAVDARPISPLNGTDDSRLGGGWSAEIDPIDFRLTGGDFHHNTVLALVK